MHWTPVRQAMLLVILLTLCAASDGCSAPDPTPTVEGRRPVIATIPDQTILEGETFSRIFLTDHVSDADHSPDEITWSHPAGVNLDIADVSGGGSVMVRIRDPEWNGSETVSFEACDPQGLCAATDVQFTVLPQNDAPVIIDDLVDQLVVAGSPYDEIILDDYVSDVDHPVEQIRWHVTGYSELAVQIVDRVVTVTAPDDHWTGSEILPFEACDPQGLCDATEVTFTATALPSVLVTYVCNEGFLVTAADTKILIDTLFDHPSYGCSSSARVQRLQSGHPPFQDVDLILTTHNHYDHFDPVVAGTYLKNSPQTILVATQDCLDDLQQQYADFAEIEQQLVAARPEYGEIVRLTVAGIDLEIIKLPHGGSDNLGFMISLGDLRLLHTGDAASTVEDIQFATMTDNEVDVAFVSNYGFLMVPVAGYQTRYVIPMHFAPGQNESELSWVEENYPHAFVFRTSMQSWVLPR